MRYCEAVLSSPLPGMIETKFYCDWRDQFFLTAYECFVQCSPLMISKSEASFLVLLVFSLFVLGLVFGVVKAVVE
jgi:hypothetical protein